MVQQIIRTGVDDMDLPQRTKCLGIIDRLRELGIQESISLPQLVVVGDQSSGKSSLLEGLTGLSFPVASDLCTRFATQLVLRRTAHEQSSVKISIIPGPTSQMDEQAKLHLEGFGYSNQTAVLDGDKLGDILNKVQHYKPHRFIPHPN